jgi:apolipoprotein N-acyltransferase
MQLASVTGIWGISFLITWFASVMNRIWSQNFEWNKIRKSVIVFTTVFAMVMLFGSIRLNFFQPQTSSVLTASIVQPRDINKSLLTCNWTNSISIGNYSTALESNLLEKTLQAAHAGAKIILWQEGAGWLPEQEETAFIERASQLAATEKIYLLMTLWTVPDDYPEHLVENKLIMINPDGTKQFNYIKSHPVSVEPIVKGDGVIPVVQTQYGRIAAAICFDGDFPNFISAAGRNKTDVLFLPANDWKEVDPLHTNMQITRAIENGFSLVRAAGQGLSVATDNNGKIISSLDYYGTDEQVMYAAIPVRHGFTIYTAIGDAFAWLCITGLLSAIVFVLLKKVPITMEAVYSKKIKAGVAE